jgi:hypothetical protein
MNREIVAKLLDDVLEESYAGLRSLAVIGRAADVRQFVAAVRTQLGFRGELELFATDLVDAESGDDVRSCVRLAEMRSSTVVIVDDEDKEATLSLLMEHASAGATPRVLLAGYGHYAFRDQKFQSIIESLLVPSIANGYPNCLVHIYQCLQHAAALGLDGCVAEFGVFKGGTTRFIAEVITSLNRPWQIYGFDTFEGFPSRRSLLDMYDHEGAEYSRFPLIEQYLSDTNVELVRGDIVQTAAVLRERPMILTFVDTDNYTAARAAIEAVADSTIVGGAIVLDHFTGEQRFRYTLGERMAAKELLVPDPRYFNLHGTGVFLRCES